jgi:hypothetical protein
MLKGAISSTKGQHVTRITCCDWRRMNVTGVTLMRPETHLCDQRHTYATRDTLMRLESHIGDVICDWSHKYVTEEAICVWSRNCATAPVASSPGDMLIRIAYIADHLGLISLSPLMYYFTFMQATLIHLHNKTRSALVTHHYYCLGTSSNQPWWI